MDDPICVTCTQRHPNMADGETDPGGDPGCDWDTFPGWGWREWYTNNGWILHEDVQTGEPVWLKKILSPPGWGMWAEYEPGTPTPGGIRMTWTAEEYAICFTRLEQGEG
jgi:hypothetical protein